MIVPFVHQTFYFWAYLLYTRHLFLSLLEKFDLGLKIWISHSKLPRLIENTSHVNDVKIFSNRDVNNIKFLTLSWEYPVRF